MQTANLSRVQTKIGTLVTEFVTQKWQSERPYFRADDLRRYVLTRTGAAPASPDRILRQLRLEGKFDYRVVSRSASQYQILGIGGSRSASKTRTVKLLYRGKQIDTFEATGRRPAGGSSCPSTSSPIFFPPTTSSCKHETLLRPTRT